MVNIASYGAWSFLDAMGALLTLLNIMALPAVILIIAGGIFWYTGWQQHHIDKIRLGRMLLMFGIILLVIVLITTYYLEHVQTGTLAIEL